MQQNELGVDDAGYADLAGRLDQLCQRLPGARDLRRTVDDLRGPLRVAVTGRFGTGRDTLARALRRCFDVTPIGPGDDAADADAWLHVIAGWPRPDDHVALEHLDPRRSLVILGKADSLGSWPAARERAAECSELLGRPVIALMPLLAVADLHEDDFDFLSDLAGSGESVPPMHAGFIDAGGPHQRLARIALLRSLDAYGIACALGLFGHGPLDPAELAEHLEGRSGLGALTDVLDGFAAVAEHSRLRRVAGELELIAARGLLRDQIEHLLAGSLLAGAGGSELIEAGR